MYSWEVAKWLLRPRPRGFEYLVLRHEPAHDSFWTPVVGEMRPEETLYQAAVRSVGETVGLAEPEQVLDLRLATHTQIGDIDEIDWSVGYRTHQSPTDLRLAQDVADLRWLDFDRSYRDMDLEEDRRSIMRLHFTLRDAG